MVVADRAAQDVRELVGAQHRRPGPVQGLPVRHPGQFGGDQIGQTGKVDAAVAVLGDPVPVVDAITGPFQGSGSSGQSRQNGSSSPAAFR
ncbi:hypothetical protein [Streptomyces sp. T028]|uniref:hypothetical protein n=1 Tax=Streptomyces sp. T028 TaxID=3394379 RepID=UPI003A866F44